MGDNTMNEKQQILEIIEKYPRHYSKLIKKNAALVQWIDTNNQATADLFLAKLRSALYNETDACKNGKVKKITRLSAGFIGCGPAASCKCVAESISRNVALTKQSTPTTQKAAANKKRAATMLDKYGVEHNLQRESVKATLAKPKITIESHTALVDKDWLYTEYVTNQRTLVDIAQELNVYYGTVGDYCRRFGFDIRSNSNYSLTERAVADYIKQLGVTVELNNRSVLNGLELDIYCPEHKLGVEINGLYWHSYHPALGVPESKYKYKHMRKADAAKENNIQLLQFTDQQWVNKQDIVKSIIASKLGKNQRIYARQCQVATLDSKSARLFFEKNHLDGFASASYYLALVYNGSTVQAISVSKHRFQANTDATELVRMASAQGITVVGGVSKLIKHLPAEYRNTLRTFCSKDISSAAGYQASGFELVNSTGPGYYWTNGTDVISRQRAQKANLRQWLPSFAEDKSEADNMFAAGYRRYWNSGNWYLTLQQ